MDHTLAWKFAERSANGEENMGADSHTIKTQWERLAHMAYLQDRVAPGHYTNVRKAAHFKRNNVTVIGQV